MATFEIEGGIPLSGTVVISGAKNEALKIIALAVSLNGKLVCHNVPDISDVVSQLKIFKKLGGHFEFENNILKLDSSGIDSFKVDRDIGCKLRASIVFMGPLLAKFSRAEIPFPGGCIIGARPIDTHLDAFKQLGAQIEETEQYVLLKIPQLLNNVVNLSERSVSATENILLFAANTPREIIINNCAVEPEIIDLVEKIKLSGALVEKVGERSFKILGAKELSLDECAIMPDRIEAGSYLIAYLATGGMGEIKNFPAHELGAFLEVLKKSGAKFEFSDGTMRVFPTKNFRPFEISTAPYPGFPTDLQSPMALIASLADGESIINEQMFENRLGYIKELQKMGLKAEVIDDHQVKIFGATALSATATESLDLRSGMTILIAALMAKGKSKIIKAELIDRGYEKVVEKFGAISARIGRYE